MYTTIIKQTRLSGKVKGVVLISTILYDGGNYETLALRRDYLDMDSSTDETESAALAAHAEMVKAFDPATCPPAPVLPLSGKYARLRDDLKASAETARAAAALVEDKGTCNLDAVSLYLPRWQKAKVKQAAEEAGLGCFEWKLFGSNRYVFPLRVGQAYKRETAAKTMTAEMEAKGYDAFCYQEMD